MEKEKKSFKEILETVLGILFLAYGAYFIFKNYSDNVTGFLARHAEEAAIYLSGVVASFVFSLIFVTITAIKQTGIFSQNMKKVGIRISWMYGNVKEISEGFQDPTSFIGFVKKYLILILVCLIGSIIGSWLNLIFTFFGLIKLPFAYFSDLMAPPDIKGARWRLKNVNLDFDGVMNQLAIIKGAPVDKLERAQMIESLHYRNLIDKYEYEKLSGHERPEN